MNPDQVADMHGPISAEELAFWNRNFQFSAFLPDFSACLEQQASESARYRLQRQEQHSAGIDEYYGQHARQFVRKYQRSPAPARACIFVHGGYWRALSVEAHDFVGMRLASEADFYNVEYRLQPSTGFQDQISDVQCGIGMALQHCSQRGIEKIDILGHSAGGHLAFCAMQGTEISAAHEPVEITLNCISGIYDLEPLSRSFLAKDISLSAADVQQFSPLNLQTPFAKIRYLLCVGENETPEYFRQAFQMLRKLIQCGHQADFRQLPKAHHMQAVQAFLDN